MSKQHELKEEKMRAGQEHYSRFQTITVPPIVFWFVSLRQRDLGKKPDAPPRYRKDTFNLHSLYSQSKFFPVNLISIPEQIARRRVFREGFNELSSGPFSRRMRCNIEVDDLASVMQQDYETVQVAEGQCRNGEKVDGGNLLCMIGEKCLPSLRRRRAAPDSILRHSRFRKVETEKTKFRLDPRRSPERVFERHPFDQLTNLLVDLRTADWRLGLPSPRQLESLPAPFDDGLRFDDDQDLPPILPELFIRCAHHQK